MSDTFFGSGRIVAADAREVTCLAREGKRTGGERQQVPVTLSATEFISNWYAEGIQMTDRDPNPDEMPIDVDFSDAANPEVGKYTHHFKEVRMVVLDQDIVIHNASIFAMS